MGNLNKKEVVDKILNSKTFQKTSTSAALLRYLVNEEIKGNLLKENIIDVEFFGGNSTPDNTNARVRVNIYNLRKKLKEYYTNEGENDEWKLLIDKGQYSVRYEKSTPTKITLSKISLKAVIPYILLFLVSLLFYFQIQPPKKPELWKNFLENNYNTTLFIGDAFALRGKTITGTQGYTRDYNINSVNEYYKFIDEKPELKDLIFPSEYFYITGMGAQSANNISRIFGNYNNGFSIRFASNTSYVDLKTGNNLYVGPFQNQDKFMTIFNNGNPNFQLNNLTIDFRNHKTLKDTVYNIDNVGQDSEYAIVSRFQGLQDKEYFMFFSNHDIGVMATVEFFTNKDSLKVFSEKYLKGKSNFTAIYKVFGKNRTNMDLKTLQIVPY